MINYNMGISQSAESVFWEHEAVGSIPTSRIRLVGLSGNIRANELFLSSDFSSWS